MCVIPSLILWKVGIGLKLENLLIELLFEGKVCINTYSAIHCCQKGKSIYFLN